MEKLKKYLLKNIVVIMMVSMSLCIVHGNSDNLSTVYADTTVYITKTGSKYHSHKCGNGTYYKSTLSYAVSIGLEPCKKCYGSNPPSASSSTKKKSNIKLNYTSRVLIVGQSVKLRLKGTSLRIKWKTSNKKIAKVSSKGKVTAKKKGSAVITATTSNAKKKCKIKVENPQMSQSKCVMQIDDEMYLYLKGCGHDVEWSSSNPDVADVYDGYVEAYEAGTTVIKAKVHNKTFRCVVVVEETTKDDTCLEDSY